MAPSATKRRKLIHSSDDDRSGERIDGNGSDGTGFSNTFTEEHRDDGDDGDALMHDTTHSEIRKEPSLPSTSAHKTEAPNAGTQREQGEKAHKRPGTVLEDGVYTAGIYKSNMFKLQVDELLLQVKPKYGKKEAPAEHAMRMLKNIIEQIPSRDPVSIAEAETILHSEGVAIPFPNPRPPKDAKYKLQYERPSGVNATGSYPSKIATRTEDSLAIDLVVTMPDTIFQEKDYMNHRYFYKRAYFLACLAAGLKNAKDHQFHLSYHCLNGNHLQPIVVVSPNQNGGEDDFSSSKCVIHILLAFSENFFPKKKLLPKSNCVRLGNTGDKSEVKISKPTPFYNSTLQADIAITGYLKLLHATSGICDAFQDACILGRVWLKQRGLGSRLHKGGFGNFEWAAMMAVLLQHNPGTGTPILLPGYSSYQLFKATLQFLARHDLFKLPYKFRAGDVTFPKDDPAPTFFDGARNMNLLFKMTPWSYARLQFEAKSTIEMLGDTLFDQFDSTFILRTDLVQYQYDATLKIPLFTLGLDNANEEYHQCLFEAVRKTYSLLSRALTDRVTGITVSLPDEAEWPVTSSVKPEDQRKMILINFMIDPTNAGRTIDHGPPAEDKKAAISFRQFWGEKAELRRFKDGSILESVVWAFKDASVSVIEQITRYITKRHLGSDVADGAEFVGDSFAQLITSGRAHGQSSIAGFGPRMNALTTLEKDIRSLDGLPLQIRHINAADPLLRYTAMEVDSVDVPASIVVQFEGSARWPDDLCAIQRTKIAFLLKLSDLLSTDKPTYITRVGLENPSQPSQNQAYLDMVLPSGFSFRLRIHHDREATLLDRQLKDKSLDAPSRESAATALAVYRQDYVHIPSHTQALQILCTRFPALSPSIRLTKRWFSSHMLLPHFSAELVELLVVRTFLQPYPWGVPACATTGFLRTLMWISAWDWRHVPLIVNFSSASPSTDDTEAQGAVSRTLKSHDIERIRTRFEAWRRIDPAMNRVVLFAATNLDTEGTTWTDRGQPEKVVAARLTALAKAATSAIRIEEDRLSSATNGSAVVVDKLIPERLFVSEMQAYDFVIHLVAKHSKSGKKRSEARYKNLEIQQGALGLADRENIGYTPAQLFAEELVEVYGDAVLWFWDPERLDVIAGLWNPGSTSQRSWRVKASWNSVPLKTTRKGEADEDSDLNLIQANKPAIYSEIQRLGSDLIARIEVNR